MSGADVRVGPVGGASGIDTKSWDFRSNQDSQNRPTPQQQMRHVGPSVGPSGGLPVTPVSNGWVTVRNIEARKNGGLLGWVGNSQASERHQCQILGFRVEPEFPNLNKFKKERRSETEPFQRPSPLGFRSSTVVDSHDSRFEKVINRDD